MALTIPPVPVPAMLIAAALIPAAPILAVLDTNVVLDLLLFKDRRVQTLHQALAAHQLCWVATEAMLCELDHVLRRPQLSAWGHSSDHLMAEARRLCQQVPACNDTAGPVPRCTDADDQIFIDLAWRWPAPLLFSRDHALLRLARRARAHGLWIGTPERWPAVPQAPQEQRRPKPPL